MKEDFKGLGYQPARQWRRDCELARLLCDAETARLQRIGVLQGEGSHRGRTAAALNELLTGAMPKVVDLERLLSRVVSLGQMSARSISILQTSMPKLRTTAVKGRALAVAVSEIIHFVDAGVAPGDGVRLYLVVAREPGNLVIGIATTGGFMPVAPAFATAGMIRAKRIVQALGGSFQRGSDKERMAFGITFDGVGDIAHRAG